MAELWLIRHGETEWSVSGQHTGRSDIPLTAMGEMQAARLRLRLQAHAFSLILTSPLRRARETSQLAGLGKDAVIDDNLAEWDYGAYDGRTAAQISMERPGWNLWDFGVPGGETLEQVGARAEQAIARAIAASGDVAIFAHGHILKVLAARWLGLAPVMGRLFSLGTASVSVLSRESNQNVLQLWNDVSHLGKSE